MTRRSFVIFSFVLAVLLHQAVAVTALGADRINTLEKKGFFSYKASGIAIRGYDTVAYFTLGKPTKGSEQFSTDWMGASWQFASQQHLDLFSAEPEKYAPQYGGYCAYGIANDYLVKIEPEQWEILDQKLYLNYDKGVQKKWEKNKLKFISEADSKFESLLQQN